MSIYRNATERDWELSGPDFWPRITSEVPVDRFIIGRPEIAYRLARRRMEKIRENEQRDTEPEYIGIRIFRQYEVDDKKGKPKRKAKSLHRFSHQINREDDSEDVREFLSRLRSMLLKCMPDQTTSNCWAQLRFHDRERPAFQLLLFQKRWL